MARSTTRRLALDRVARICASPTDVRTLRLSLLPEFRRMVAFDAYAWLLTDPETSVGTAPLADVPDLAQLPRLIRLRYLTQLNRWTGSDGVAIAHLAEAAEHGSSTSLSWPRLLLGCGIDTVATLVFRDRYGCWGWLDLWRGSTRGPFSRQEVDDLESLLAPVTSALRRGQALSFVGRRPRGPRAPGPIVLLLSPDLEVLSLTPPTQEYLRALVPPARDEAPIPANAYNVAAQLLAVEAGVDDNPAVARTHLSDGLWVTLRAARLGETRPLDQRSIAVTIEETTPSERVELFCRAFGLSPREGELVSHLTTGVDTRELAQRMLVAESTVQDYLKSVFAKTSTRSRGAVVSLALGS